jgi:hypothetical protein
LGWRARIPLEEGLNQAVAAFRRELQNNSLRSV